MRATFYGMEIAKSALYAAQSALDVASHNIANADTIGYTRQRLVTSSVPASNANTFLHVDNKTVAGRGVAAQYIEQLRNPFLDKQYRSLSSATGGSSIKATEFAKIESLFNAELEDTESNTGISSVFGDFYSSLYRLTEDPSSQEIRRAMADNSVAMTETLNYYYNSIVDQQDSINTNVNTTVGMINQTAEEIAKLNKMIFTTELTGERANDLRDQRNNLLDTLSSKVDIEYAENSDNELIVTIGGKTLIDYTEVNKLAAVATKDNEATVPGSGYLYEVYWEASGAKADVSSFSSLSGISDVDFVQTSGAAAAANATLTVGYAAGSFTLGALTSSSAGFTQGDFANGGNYRIVFTDGVGKQQVLDFDVAAGAYADQAALGAALGGHTIGVQTGFPGEKVNLADGELKGYLDIRDGNTETQKGIPKIISELNTLVRKIVSDFNAQHEKGYTLHEWDTVNNVSGSVTGVKYFEDFGDITKVTAGNFAVRDAIINDLNNIATSDAPVNQLNAANNQKGNNANVLALSKLITGTVDGKGNFDGAYKSIAVGIGTEMDKLNKFESANTVRRDQIVLQRASYSGVSVDEEMIDVIRYGKSYNAASRLITAMDEQLDTIINKMGMVGR